MAGDATRQTSADGEPLSSHFARPLGLVATLAGTAIAAFVVGPIVSVGFVSIAFGVRRGRRRTRRARELRLLGEELAFISDVAAAIIAGGLTPARAMEEIARTHRGLLAREVIVAVSNHRRGLSFASAFEPLIERTAGAARPLVELLTAPDRHGTAIADDLGRLARAQHDDLRRSSEAAARQLPVKLLFPLVLCILPAFVLVTVVPVVADAVASFSS